MLFLERYMRKSKERKISSYNQISMVGDVVYYNKNNKMAKLSKNQIKLFHCLLNGMGEKSQIINFIWGGGSLTETEFKYNQLICRTRSKLTRSGFPSDIILTIPKFGVCINKAPTPLNGRLNHDVIELDIDSRVIHSFHF